MPLEVGQKLGPYEILAPIGAGGMGYVYRARDAKLDRHVAIKVLSEEVATDPERVARFEREAKLLALLNHPNIASIYGLEEADGVTALVLELVEGPTLAERIEHGPIPVDEAVAIAKQIVEALEAGHEAGVIHRDLKPANIKLREDGTVKVLDYGLAKALECDAPKADSELSQSPTLTRQGTQVGVILGTAAYMSPEQAKGKPVDQRADVWAFGAVLYEMLVGHRAFGGEDVSDTLVSVLRDDPDWTALPEATPRTIRQAMRVCLQKNAKDRIRDIGAVRLVMAGAFETAAAVSVDQATDSRRRRRTVPALLAAGLAVAAALVTWGVTRSSPVAPKVTRTSIVLPPSHVRTNRDFPGVAISPSGTHIAYVANGQIYLRALDALDAEPLSGTEARRPVVPFFSPDDQWVGFYSMRDRELQKVAITGGSAVSLCAAPFIPKGASWSRDGTIVYEQAMAGIFRVPAAGGTPETVVSQEEGERVHSPQLLPDGRTLLFTLGRNDWDEAQIVAQSLDSGERRVLVDGGASARYLDTGHLVYALADDLLAVSFDSDALEITGGPVPVVGNISRTAWSGAANFDVSGDGTLVYLADPGGGARTLVWVNREGREETLVAEPARYAEPRISPDGRTAVLVRADGENDLWVWDFARETMNRLTFGAAVEEFPVWMPDGRSVIFASNRMSGRDLFRKLVDGTEDAVLLSERANDQFPMAVSPDGTQLVFHEFDDDHESMSVVVMSLDGERTEETLLDTGFFNTNGDLSPDGEWFAYASDASGDYEIYVRPFPDIDSGQWQISSGGGDTPLWGPDSRELFFWNQEDTLMRVAIDTRNGFRPGIPEPIIENPSYFFSEFYRTFDISPDGERFLMIKESAGKSDDSLAGPTRFVVVQNWFEELKRLVPTDH